MPFANPTHTKVTEKGTIGMVFQNIMERNDVGWLGRLSTHVMADNIVETLSGLGTPPEMREWIGGRDRQQLREIQVSVSTKPYELTMPIPRMLIRLDKTDQVGNIASQFATRVMNHPRKLLFDFINAGSGTTLAAAYDGLPLFDGSHDPGNGVTFSNEITVDLATLPVNSNVATDSVTNPSKDELIQCVLKGIQQIRGFKDDQGAPVNEDVTNFILIYPQNYEMQMRVAFASMMLNQTDVNPLYGNGGLNITPVVGTRLTATDKLYIFADNPNAVGAFLEVEFDSPEITALWEGSEHWSKHNEALLMAYRRYGFGIGRFDQCCSVQLTT